MGLTAVGGRRPVVSSVEPSAVFLDRDGVINENRYVTTWEDVVFLPRVFDALRHLAHSPFLVILVTNQSVIGRGMASQEAVEAINRQLVTEIQAHGGRIDGVFYCPHHPDDGCDCRKPRPGLLLQAARELHIDLARSYLVGDAVSDIEAALAVGASSILVLTGRGQEQWSLLQQREYAHVPVAQDLAEAVSLILNREQ